MPTVAHAPAALLPDVQASQSTVIVTALIGAFLLWLLLTGRLATYWALMTGGGAAASAPGMTGPGAPSSGTTGPGTPSPNPGTSGPPGPSSVPIPNLSTIPGTNIPNPLCILGGPACGKPPPLKFTVPGQP